MSTPDIEVDDSLSCSEWIDLAAEALLEAARRGGIVTADSIVGEVPAPRNPKWIGFGVLEAQRRGYVVETGVTRSGRATRHSGLLRTWVLGPGMAAPA